MMISDRQLLCSKCMHNFISITPRVPSNISMHCALISRQISGHNVWSRHHHKKASHGYETKMCVCTQCNWIMDAVSEFCECDHCATKRGIHLYYIIRVKVSEWVNTRAPTKYTYTYNVPMLPAPLSTYEPENRRPFGIIQSKFHHSSIRRILLAPRERQRQIDGAIMRDRAHTVHISM